MPINEFVSSLRVDERAALRRGVMDARPGLLGRLSQALLRLGIDPMDASVDLDAVGRVLSRVTHPSANHPLARSLGELPNAQKTGSIPDMRFRRMLGSGWPEEREKRLTQAIGMLSGRVDANEIARLMANWGNDADLKKMARDFYDEAARNTKK